jgi:hypothetical protein
MKKYIFFVIFEVVQKCNQHLIKYIKKGRARLKKLASTAVSRSFFA